MMHKIIFLDENLKKIVKESEGLFCTVIVSHAGKWRMVPPNFFHYFLEILDNRQKINSIAQKI